MSERRFILLLFLLHAVYFIVAIGLNRIYLKDSAEYLWQAFNLMHNGNWYAGDLTLPVQPYLYSFRPPLYGTFIMLCKLFVSTDLFVLFVQNLQSIVNLILVHRFLNGSGVTFRWRSGILILMLIMFPTQLIMANMVMSEILFQTLALHLFLQLWRFASTHGQRTIWWIALLATAMVLTKPVFMLGIIPVSIWVMIWGFKHVHGTYMRLRLILPLLLFPITLAIIANINQRQTGLFHYSSMTAVNQFKYNARYVLTRSEGESFAEQFTDTLLTKWNQLPYAGRDHMMMHTADSVILAHPVAFTINYMRGTIAFMLDPGRHDIATFLNLQAEGFEGFMYKVNRDGVQALSILLEPELRMQMILIVVPFLGNLATLLLLILFLVQRHESMLKWLILGMVLYFIIATGMLGVARYRTVIFPQLMMMVVLTLDHWYKRKATP